MSYRSRESRRRRNVAIARAQENARASGSSVEKWWLTLVRKDTCCATCAGMLRKGREMVYRHRPGESLCRSCADRAGVVYGPSVRWKKPR